MYKDTLVSASANSDTEIWNKPPTVDSTELSKF